MQAWPGERNFISQWFGRIIWPSKTLLLQNPRRRSFVPLGRTRLSVIFRSFPTREERSARGPRPSRARPFKWLSLAFWPKSQFWEWTKQYTVNPLKTLLSFRIVPITCAETLYSICRVSFRYDWFCVICDFVIFVLSCKALPSNKRCWDPVYVISLYFQRQLNMVMTHGMVILAFNRPAVIQMTGQTHVCYVCFCHSTIHRCQSACAAYARVVFSRRVALPTMFKTSDVNIAHCLISTDFYTRNTILYRKCESVAVRLLQSIRSLKVPKIKQIVSLLTSHRTMQIYV